jgi:large subunit ribosomal protein L25
MQTSIQIKAENRSQTGTGSARAARKSEKIPAIIYGFGQEHKIEISSKEFMKEYLKGGISSKLATIDLDDKKMNVITRDVQVHPVTDNPIHVDFQQIDEAQPIKVSIRFKVTNEQKCFAIKRGGVLNIVLRQAKFYCLPRYIKSSIEIDITHLKMGQSIHINDITLPEGVTPVNKANFVIVSIAGRADDASDDGQNI